MAVMDRGQARPPQKHYDLVLVDYVGDKTRSAAIVMLGYFCGIQDSFAAQCFDSLPDFKMILKTSTKKDELILISESLSSHEFVVEIREEIS